MKNTLAACALLVLVALAGCGPKGGHTTDSWGPYNVLVHNYDDSNDLEVFVRGTDMGTISGGRTGYFWVTPGPGDVDLISDAKDVNGNDISADSNVDFPQQGFVQLDFND